MERLFAFLHSCWELSMAGAPYILGGVIAAGFLHLWLPEDFVARHLGKNDAKGVGKAALFGMPLPVCSCSVIPLAASMILAGFSPGAAFVFLTAGPATNTVTLSVVARMLGKRALGIYLASIVIGSLLFGVGMDALFAGMALEVKEVVHLREENGPLFLFSNLAMLGLIGWYVVIRPLKGKKPFRG